MKVFLSMPYSQLCDENYIVKEKYKKFFQNLINALENIGVEYYLACKRENWGKDYCSAEESTKIDFDALKNSDLICVIPGIPYSGGVHIEIGWASSFKKKINMFLKKGEFYSPVVTGLNSITDVKYHYYNDDYNDELLNKIINSVLNFTKEER